MKYKNWVTEIVYNLVEFIIDIFSLFAKFPEPPVTEPIVTEPEPIEVPAPEITNRERLYNMAKVCLTPARDVSPQDFAADEVACVESFEAIHKLTFGAYISKKRIPTLSTIICYNILSQSPEWERVQKPEPGDVILSVTGTGNGYVSNGHVGICGKTHIMSNNSFSGKWEANYTPTSWKNYYERKGGMKTHYFRKK